MSAPVGGVFYYELKYANTKGKVTAGQKLIKDFNAYYSSQKVDEEVVGVGPGTSFSSTLDYTPVKSATVIVSAGSVSGIDDGSGAIVGTGVSGTIDYTTGSISLTFGSSVGSGVSVVAEYEYDMECNDNIPGVNIDIELQEIKAKSRKLKANWCAEAADDLKAFHGVDADAELTASLAAEIALEIDREIIEELRKAAALSNSTSGYDVTTIPSGRTELDVIRGLITPMTKASNQIHQSSLRGPANFGVTSSTVMSYIEQLETHGDFRPLFAAPNADRNAPVEQPHTFAVQKMGTLASKYMMYKDVYFPVTNEGTGTGFGDILLGYKGPSYLDAGAVYAPYIPLQISSTFYDPDTGTFKKLARTRYSFRVLRSDFYRRVRVGGL